MNPSLKELIERYKRGDGDKTAILEWLKANATRPGGGEQAPAPVPVTLPAEARPPAPAPDSPAVSAEPLATRVQAELLELLSGILKVELPDLDPEASLEEFGFDSISLNEFTRILENRWKVELSAADLMEYGSIGRLSAYFASKYSAALSAIYSGTVGAAPTGPAESPSPAAFSGEAVSQPAPQTLDAANAASAPTEFPPRAEGDRSVEPIAIIGMSGSFPGSPDLESFWRHLAEGHDLISEIPAERKKRWGGFEHLDKDQANRPRFAGIMDNVDKFDCHFFNISPREAELMDPQQRIVLETVWHTLEDAGYRPSSLSGSRVGFFIAVTGDDYTTLAVRQFRTFDPYLATGCNRSLLANRVSHFFNWRGPSEPVDTACSSSLLAVHRAFKAIRSGECDTAVAGGVNLLLAPTAFAAFAKLGMLAPDGRCKPFDERADGFVRGEGVGAVMLKPLSRALADGDTIRAVIRGSAVNHAGKTSSLTVPGSGGQAECVIQAMEGAGFDPASVGYIEAHGTGTKIGDPVEIKALQQAFAELGRRSARSAGAPEPRCGIGSVKSNVGNLEGTAGIVAMIKVVQALEHRLLPGLLHFERLSPAIALGDGPFYIVDSTRDWEPVRDSSGRPMPLRAGVNSFGFGGVNVHVAVEEFVAPAADELRGGLEEPQVVVLSAKTPERLRAVAARMRDFLREEGGPPLRDVAYTLRERREEFAERLAFVARTRGEAAEKLDQFLGETPADGLFVGRIREKSAAGSGSPNGAAAAEGWNDAALDWSRGTNVDWSRLYPRGGGRRVRLPLYPFERKAHWLPEEIFETAAEPATGSRGLSVARGPRDEAGTYHRELKGDEFYLADHRIGGSTILPAAAYLELAWSAASQWLGPGRPFHLQSAVWIRPILFEGPPLRLRVAVRPKGELWGFEISAWDATSEEWRLHAQGAFALDGAEKAPPRIAAAALADVRRGSALKMGKAQLYAQYASGGFEYGAGLRSIEEIWASAGEVLARVRLPSERVDDFASYALHPSILDGALQSVVGFALAAPGASGVVRLPFSVGKVRRHRQLVPEVLIHLRARGDRAAAPAVQQRYDINVIDDAGRILLSMEDFVTRQRGPVPADSETGGPADGHALVFGDFAWREPDRFQARASSASGLLLLGGDAAFAAKLAGTAGAEVIRVSAGGSFERAGPLHWRIDRADPDHYVQLLDSLRGDGKLPQGVVHAWSLEDGAGNGLGAMPAKLESGLYSLLHLSQAWIKVRQKSPLTLVYGHSGTDPCHVMVDGFLRSLVQEVSSVRGATAQVGGPDDLLDLYAAASGSAAPETVREQACQLRKRDGRWEQRRLVKAAACDAPMPLAERGVYLITGAMGGLGRILAAHLAGTYRARLILCGRAPLDADKADFLGRLRALGAEVDYQSGDIREPDDVRRWVGRACELWGGLHGVFHCAGALQDGAFHRKSVASIQTLLDPKLAGTVNLFDASRGLGVEFMALFSSVASVGGGRGQTDYASANRFLDAFAAGSAEAPADGDAPRRVISINWPLWADGGMKMPAPMREKMAQVSGMAPMPAREGLRALETALRMDLAQVAVFYGDASKLRNFLHLEPGPADPAAPAAPVSDEAEVGAAVAEIVSSTLKVEAGELDLATDLSEYGVDSIMATQLLNRVEVRFDCRLDPASITEWTIGGLVRCLLESRAGAAAAAMRPAAALSDEAEVGAAVAEIVSSTLKVEAGELDLATDLSEYGVDSIMATQLLNRVEVRFDCRLDPASITEWTIGGLVRCLLESGAGIPMLARVSVARPA